MTDATGVPQQLSEVFAYLETYLDDDERRRLKATIESKRLTRKNFFDAAAWAILVAYSSRAKAQTWWDKAKECDFPFNWKRLGEWQDGNFDDWCRKMAKQLASPKEDLTGKFRDRWWGIWHVGWQIAQYNTADDFREDFFAGKAEGADLTEMDLYRLEAIKERDQYSLYLIGRANMPFILRNLGGDFLKPDVWIRAFCRWYGASVSGLAVQLRNEGIHCGRFDVFLWRYCEREIKATRNLATHLDGVFGSPQDERVVRA